MNYLNKKTAVQSTQLRQLFSAANASLITGTLLAAILAYVQREVIASSVVITWFSLIVLVAFCRRLLINAYQASPPDGEAANRFWLKRFRLGVLAIGVVWGSAGFAMFPAQGPQHQMFLIFMLTGLSAGGVISFSADLASAIVFSITSLLPVIIRLFITDDSLFVAMGMAGMLYLGFMIISLRRINRSITGNVVLQLDAIEREEAMRTSEQRYRLLLKHSPIGIFHYNMNLVITYCNEPFADILHNTVDGIVGLDMATFKDQSILTVLKNALKDEKVVYEGPYCAPFSTDSIWIDMTCGPSRDGAGRIVGGIAIIRDTTERKHLEQQEKQHLDELAHITRLGLMGEMASGIAHEINQPLEAISAYTQVCLNLINSENPDPARLVDILTKAQQQALRAGRIIHRMREFMKSHSEKRSAADVNTLICNCVEMCASELKQNGMELNLELENNLPLFEVDSIQIEQVIINLIRNSMDALRTLPEKQQRRLTIRSFLTPNHSLRVEVKDNGCGINEDQKQKILTPFYTTKTEGMGMGLSISQSLIEAYEGTLHFNSKQGKGTTFYFTLPLERAKEKTGDGDCLG